MYKKLLLALLPAFAFASCSKLPPHITVVCEENNVGNSIVKWETTPLVKGEVKVFASSDPRHIPEEKVVARAPISDQRLTIATDDPTRRYYYTLLFNDRYRVKVATRNINIPGIQNFRDLGGYPVYPVHKEVRWGMIYRSAEIDNLEEASIRELKNIGIKTIIDLRAPHEADRTRTLERNFCVVSIPIHTDNPGAIVQGVQDRSIRSDTVYRIVERMNRELITRYTQQYRRVFDLLLDKQNYPLVIHCSTGKGRTGIVSALILAALGVDDELILEDYRLSNDYFNIPKASGYAYHLPARSQEAITTLFSAREDFLIAAKEAAERQYGDIDTYLKEGVGLTKKEIKRLRSILLE